MMIVALFGVSLTAVGNAPAQESKFGLSGIFDIGSTNSSSLNQVYLHPASTTDSSSFTWGLDLSLRTYILDPRFITLTFEPSVHRGSGRTDAQGNNESELGGAFFLDFLKNGFFPFRFHFIDQNLNYQQEHLNSAAVARRSIGFDWTLRKPKLPNIFINYDDSRFNYDFAFAPEALTRTSNFLVSSQANYAAWTTNAGWSRQSGTEAFTGLGTGADLLRGSAARKLWSSSQLSINALYENLKLSNEPSAAALHIPYWSLRTDLRTRFSDRLSTMFSHQYYRTGGETGLAAPGPATAPSTSGSTNFNELRSLMSYRVSPSLTVEESTNGAFVSTPFDFIEAPTRTLTVLGSIHWQRKISFLQTRAGYDRGIEYAASNKGHSREISLQASNVGLSIGDPRRMLFSADGTYSQRPDLYEIGGRFTQQVATASLDSQAIPGLHVRASMGINQFEFLTLTGRERFHTQTWTTAISRSIFTVSASRNTGLSLLNLLEGPGAITPQQLFFALPLEALSTAPFSATTGVYTTGAFNVRPRKRFEFDARYLRQRMLFTTAPGVLLRQYEAYATWRLGKFTFTAGILYVGDSIEQQDHNLNRYYFFRISRPFRIF